MRITRKYMEERRLDETRLRDLARRAVKNQVFIANSPSAIKNAFMAMLAFTSIDEDAVPLIGALYAPLSERFPQSVNGYPVFYSVAFLHREDLAALVETIKSMEEALK